MVDRRTLARYVAPALFLLAVTGVVLAVRAGLRSGSSPAGTASTLSVTVARKTATQPKPSAPKQYYVIRPGDTLGGIASQLGTTVAELLRLNPGVEPTTLRPGERVRVR